MLSVWAGSAWSGCPLSRGTAANLTQERHSYSNCTWQTSRGRFEHLLGITCPPPGPPLHIPLRACHGGGEAAAAQQLQALLRGTCRYSFVTFALLPGSIGPPMLFTMKAPDRIGTVGDLVPGQVAFAPVASLFAPGAGAALAAGAGVYDAPVATCLRLVRQANGSIQVSLYGNALNEVLRGGRAGLFAGIGRTGVAAELAARHAPVYDERVKKLVQGLAFGPKRMEIVGRQLGEIGA